MRQLLVVSVIAACARTDAPVFEAPTIFVDQGDDFDTTVRSIGTPTAPPYVMHFRGGQDAIHLPDSFTVNGQELLIPNADCTRESEIGIAVFPAATAAASFDGGDPTDNTDEVTVNYVSVETPGPHLGRVEVGYSLDYPCNGTPQTLRGRSTFMFYPTGRIVRLDREITPASGFLDATCGCLAGLGNEFFFTSYWAFQSGTANTDRTGQVVNVGGGANGACSIYPNRAIGVQFDSGGTPVETSRIGVGDRASHVFDFAARVTTLSNEAREISSSLQIGEGTMFNLTRERCDDLLVRTVKNVPILIGDTRYNGTIEEGYYNDDIGVRTEPFEIRPVPGSALPPGFTVAVQLSRGAARVTRQPGHTIEPTHYVQRGFSGDDRFYFIFNEGLQDDQSILIEPQ